MARAAMDFFESNSCSADFVDLQDIELPLCNGADCFSHPNVGPMGQRIENADAILIASPVYNFDVNAVAKNLVELTGKNAWSNKVVGFMLSAGGQGSYMSIMPFANSLMLDFRCLVLPRFVYATEDAIEDQKVSSEIKKRIDQLCDDALRVSKCFANQDAAD